jgi:hypothetical protein
MIENGQFGSLSKPSSTSMKIPPTGEVGRDLGKPARPGAQNSISSTGRSFSGIQLITNVAKVIVKQKT